MDLNDILIVLKGGKGSVLGGLGSVLGGLGSLAGGAAPAQKTSNGSVLGSIAGSVLGGIFGKKK